MHNQKTFPLDNFIPKIQEELNESRTRLLSAAKWLEAFDLARRITDDETSAVSNPIEERAKMLAEDGGLGLYDADSFSDNEPIVTSEDVKKAYDEVKNSVMASFEKLFEEAIRSNIFLQKQMFKIMEEKGKELVGNSPDHEGETENPIKKFMRSDLFFEEAVADIDDDFDWKKEPEQFYRNFAINSVKEHFAEKMPEMVRDFFNYCIKRSVPREVFVHFGSEDISKIKNAAKKENLPIALQAALSSLLTFDDIVRLSDHAVQKILRAVDADDLALALKCANDTTKEKICRNLSERAVKMLNDDMECMGAVPKKDCIAAQDKILGVINNLLALGEITLNAAGEEMV